MHPITFVSMSTVRIVCYQDSKEASIGTGFFYLVSIQLPDGVAQIPMVITNKHVVHGFSELRIVLTLSQGKDDPPDIVVSESDVHQTFVVPSLEERLIDHPSLDVDLCGFFVQDIDHHVAELGMRLRHAYIDRSWVLASGAGLSVRAFETVLMIGYPNGLWDATNNRPIARRGTTASHPFLNWNGRKILLQVWAG